MTASSRRTRFKAGSLALTLLALSFSAFPASAQNTQALPPSPNAAAVCVPPTVSPTANFSGTVRFTNLANGQSKTANYTSGNDLIGSHDQYDKGFSIFKEYFVAWQDSAGNYYLPSQKISDAFPNGLTADANLRAVWVGGLGLMSSINKGNHLTLNKDLSAPVVLPESSVLNSSTAQNVTAYYQGTPDKAQVNLTASLDLNKNIALVTYHNPGGIFTNSGQMSDGPKKGARYSHMDLHVQLGTSVTLNDTLTFDFTSYQFKPLYLLDKDYNVLAGNLDKNVQPNNPTTRISVSGLSGKNEFILRTAIRRDGTSQSSVTAPCVAALQQMSLTNASVSNFRISSTTARHHSIQGTPIEVTGYVDGTARAAGYDAAIKRIDPISPLLIHFINNRVTFEKNSTSLGDNATQTIGTGIIEHSKPITANSFTAAEKGIVWPSDPQPLTANNTTYYFTGWNTKADGSGTVFTKQVPVTADTTVYAQWAANTPPTLTLKNTTINVGDNLDLLTLVTSVSDAEDARNGATPTVTVESDGGFTNKTPGTYTVKLKATDSAGAITIATATVTVVARSKPSPTPEPTTPAPTPEPTKPVTPTPSVEPVPTIAPVSPISGPTTAEASSQTSTPSRTGKQSRRLAHTGAVAPLGLMFAALATGGMLIAVRRRKNA